LIEGRLTVNRLVVVALLGDLGLDVVHTLAHYLLQLRFLFDLLRDLGADVPDVLLFSLQILLQSRNDVFIVCKLLIDIRNQGTRCSVRPKVGKTMVTEGLRFGHSASLRPLQLHFDGSSVRSVHASKLGVTHLSGRAPLVREADCARRLVELAEHGLALLARLQAAEERSTQRTFSGRSPLLLRQDVLVLPLLRLHLLHLRLQLLMHC